MRCPTSTSVSALLLVLSAGCAGGWRDGAPPGSGAAAAPATGAPMAMVAGTTGTVTFRWTGGGNEAFVAGEFNEWSASADKLARQADGSFTLAKSLPPGRYQYKFVVDGSWKVDPEATESADDGYGGKNSVVVVGGGAAPPAPSAAGGAAAPSGAAGAGKPPEVTAAGVRFTFGGPAQSVALAGEFNAWAINADPMTRQGDGTWTIVKALAPGRYAYKFVIDGAVWKTDDANPQSVDDGFGGKNSVVEVK